SLMQLGWASFQAAMTEANRTFQAWDDHAKEFTNVARDIMRKRQQKFIPIKINARHLETQARLKYIKTFRDNHEQLQKTIVNVLGPSSGFGGEEGGSGLVDELG